MSDTTRHEDLEIDSPENGRLVIDAGHDVGYVVLGVDTYVDLEEAEPGEGMISLHTADMVELRDYLTALIRRDGELARRALADPEATEETKAAARRILAGLDSGPARKVLADESASETRQNAARKILATAYGRETP
jgi:hypothetical protein